MSLVENKNFLADLLDSTSELGPTIIKPKSIENRIFIETEEEGEGLNVTWNRWYNRTEFTIHKIQNGITTYEVNFNINPDSKDFLSLQFQTQDMKEPSKEDLPEYISREIISTLAHFNS